jgi:hypothetical protein
MPETVEAMRARDTASDAASVLAVETADAWFEYLHTCRGQHEPARYEQVEPWAWLRLQQRLRAIEARRRAHTRRTA